tara:strand:+ start:574 stop:747 length:174 start_codon:yes stop_codon:yes gene_type:complete
MKDKENVLRQLDEADNIIQVMDYSVERKMPIDPMEARRRFASVRQKLKLVIDRVTAS